MEQWNFERTPIYSVLCMESNSIQGMAPPRGRVALIEIKIAGDIATGTTY